MAFFYATLPSTTVMNFMKNNWPIYTMWWTKLTLTTGLSYTNTQGEVIVAVEIPLMG